MNIRTIVNAARRSLDRLVGRINRRRQWEREVVEVLTIAGYAAAKLRVEYQRRNIAPRAEMDQLIASEKRIRELRRGAAAYSPNVPGSATAGGKEHDGH